MNRLHSDRKHLLTGLFLMMFLLLLSGCEGDKDPAEPPDDPSEALKALAIVLDSQFFNQADVERSRMNNAQQELTPFNPTSNATETVLTELVGFSERRLWWAGVIDTEGFVRNVFPDSLDRFVGENRSDIPAVQHVLADERIDAGPVLFYSGGRRSIDYYRSIVDGNTVVGAVFGGLALDTLIARSIIYLDFSDSTGNHLFIMDDEGRIVHDEDPDLIGLNVRDSLALGNLSALADDFEEKREGSGEYVLSTIGAGHGEGEYHVGWKRRVYLENHYLIFAISRRNEAPSSMSPLQP